MCSPLRLAVRIGELLSCIIMMNYTLVTVITQHIVKILYVRRENIMAPDCFLARIIGFSGPVSIYLVLCAFDLKYYIGIVLLLI